MLIDASVVPRMKTNRRLVALAALCIFAAACGKDAPPENTAEPTHAARGSVDQGLAVIEAGGLPRSPVVQRQIAALHRGGILDFHGSS